MLPNPIEPAVLEGWDKPQIAQIKGKSFPTADNTQDDCNLESWSLIFSVLCDLFPIRKSLKKVQREQTE